MRPCAVRRRGRRRETEEGITSLRLTQEKRSFTHSPAVNMGQRRCRPEDAQWQYMHQATVTAAIEVARSAQAITSICPSLSIASRTVKHIAIFGQIPPPVFVILLSFGDRGPLCVALSLVGAIISAPLDLLNLVFNPPIKPSCDSFTCE